MPINEQIPLSAGPAGAARIDPSIPASVDSRLPMAVQPFKPIDTLAAAGDAYKLADSIDQFKENQAERLDLQKTREEKQRDKTLLQQYQQAGGDLYTSDGLTLAAKELGGKISKESFDNLTKQMTEKRKAEDQDRALLASLSDTDMELVAKHHEESSKMLNRALQVYDTTLADTKDPQKANEAYQATKLAMIQAVKDQKSPTTGKPLYPPDEAEQFAKMSPDQLRNMINSTKWHAEAIKQEQASRLKEAQTEFYGAKTAKTEADTEQNQQKIDLMKKKLEKSAGKPLNDEDSATMAEMVRTQGPQVLSRLGLTGEQRQSIISKVTELDKSEGISAREGATQIGSLKADQKSLDRLIPQLDAVTAFEKTASQVGEKLVSIAKKVDSSGVPVFERWVRAGRRSVAGDPDVTEFNSRLNTYTSETAKILNNPNLTGPTTDSARHEMQEVMPNASTFEQIERGVQVMKQESEWRKNALKEQIDAVNKRRLEGAKKAKETTQPLDGKKYKQVGKYKTPEEIRADYKAGTINREEAKTLLTQMGL